MKIALILLATTLFAAFAFYFLGSEENVIPLETSQAGSPQTANLPGDGYSALTETKPTPQSNTVSAVPETQEPDTTVSKEPEKELLTKEAIMRKFKELEANKENNPHYVVDASILNAKLALIEREENPEPNELSDEESALVERILAKIGAKDPNAKSELYDYLDEDASPALYFMAGNFSAEEGNLQAAIDFYLTGLKSENYISENTRLRMTRNAGIMMVKKGDFDAAIGPLEQAMYLADEPDTTTLGLLALSQLNSGNLKASAYYYRQAIEADPTIGDWQIGLAKVLLNSNEYEEAIEVLEHYKTLPPKG